MVQLLTKGWREDLLSIALANSSNGICKENATPHNINHIGQFSDLGIEKTIRSNPRNLKDTITKDALISQIMNCVNSSGMSEHRITMVNGMQPVRHNPCMPIIAMDDVRRPVKRSCCL